MNTSAFNIKHIFKLVINTLKLTSVIFPLKSVQRIILNIKLILDRRRKLKTEVNELKLDAMYIIDDTDI